MTFTHTGLEGIPEKQLFNLTIDDLQAMRLTIYDKSRECNKRLMKKLTGKLRYQKHYAYMRQRNPNGMKHGRLGPRIVKLGVNLWEIANGV